MVISGTVAQWEHWTGMAFPETGRYVVPEALDLVDIDREGHGPVLRAQPVDAAPVAGRPPAAVTGRNRLAAGRAGSARLGCRD
jgi:hypothetical protein